MKKNLIYLLAFVTAAFMATSCKNDDKPAAPGSTLEAKTYSVSANDFAVNLNGTAMLGKAAQFTPGNDGNATIKLGGEALNLDEIIGGIMTADDNQPVFSFPTAGVLPGSPNTDLSVDLVGDADKCAFEGSDETDYCTFSYSGSVSADKLALNLTNVKLKNLKVAGTWNLPDFDHNFYNLFRVNWVAEKGLEMFGTEMGVGVVAGVMFIKPMLSPDENGNPTKSIADMLCEVLESVTFGEDGFITARYADSENDFTMTDAPKGVAQYVVTDDNTIRVYLNPANIIASAMTLARSSRSFDVSSLIETLMTNVVPMLSNGVPVHFSPALDASGATDDSKTSFYLGTETLLPILKAVAPLFEDEDIIKAIVEAAAQSPSMSGMASTLEGILRSLPGVINTTSVVEIGINLEKAE